MTIIQADFNRQTKDPATPSPNKKPAQIYQFHVSLAFSDPFIWRRIQVPGEMNLKQFHEVLQISLGWSGEYSHQFYVGKIFYEMSSESTVKKEYDEEKFDLQTLEEAMRWCFTYLYDAGSGWEHDIVLEQTRPPAQNEGKYPILLDGECASPPEEIGGVHSYTEYLEALKNPTDGKSKKILQFHDIDAFDPDVFDLQILNKVLRETIKID